MTVTPADVFLAALRVLLFVREEPRNSNAGQAVEAFLKVCGLGKGHPWCMAVQSFAGRAAFGARWPLPMTAGCVAAAEAAKAKGLVVPREEAQPGDLVLMWHGSLGRVAHAYALTEKRGGSWCTLEGNTNDGGSRDGWGMFARERTIASKDVVVRWSAAL